MISIYEVRGDGMNLTLRRDAEAIVELMRGDKDYETSKIVQDFSGAVVGRTLGTFNDSNGARAIIDVCCDEKGYPARVQFVGIESDVLEEKKKLEDKLKNRGYRLR